MTASVYFLGGDLYGGVTPGERQRAQGQRSSSGDNALAMPQAGSFSLSANNDLAVAATLPLPPGLFPLAAGIVAYAADLIVRRRAASAG